MKKILISAPYMHREKNKVINMFNDYNYELTWATVEERLEECDLLEIINNYDGIICGDDRITEKVIDKAVNLKVIVKWGTGIDSINKDYAESKGIKVRRTLNAFTEPVADTTLAFMLADVRSIFGNDKIIKTGGWDKPQGYTLAEKTVGIIGFGFTGQAVAKRLRAFGANVLVNDILEIKQSLADSFNVTVVDKKTIYKSCDIITVHCDLNETSNKLLNKSVFDQMVRNPFIVNCARGPIINESDLVDALISGKVRGAGLDVFEHEPLAKNSKLRQMDSVIASCHNSNSSPYRWDKVHLNSIKMLVEEIGF